MGRVHIFAEQSKLTPTTIALEEKVSTLRGCLLGTAIGDALGLPYEGLSRQRGDRLFGPPDQYRLILRRGMVSDDTEHSCMVAQSLIDSDDVVTFRNTLAKRLRWWFLLLPAGVGFATMRSILKLWLGVPSDRSGVPSAGNGPCMRSAILGSYLDCPDKLISYVRASTRITHTATEAEQGAIVVALAAWFARQPPADRPQSFLNFIKSKLGSDAAELIGLLTAACESAAQKESTAEFAAGIGLERGVSGYVLHTVPVCIHAWQSFPENFDSAVRAVIECGGDTDTTAAIAGGIVGSAVGEQGLPEHFLNGLLEYPRTCKWMSQLAKSLAESTPCMISAKAPRLNPFAVLLRNAVFLTVVLGHGFRRLFPPY